MQIDTFGGSQAFCFIGKLASCVDMRDLWFEFLHSTLSVLVFIYIASFCFPAKSSSVLCYISFSELVCQHKI